MQRTLAVLNQNGGVGTTTVTLGLASAAAAAARGADPIHAVDKLWRKVRTVTRAQRSTNFRPVPLSKVSAAVPESSRSMPSPSSCPRQP